MITISTQFSQGSKSAVGGKDPLADIHPGSSYSVADLDRGGPYLLADLDPEVQILGGFKYAWTAVVIIIL